MLGRVDLVSPEVNVHGVQRLPVGSGGVAQREMVTNGFADPFLMSDAKSKQRRTFSLFSLMDVVVFCLLHSYTASLSLSLSLSLCDIVKCFF